MQSSVPLRRLACSEFPNDNPQLHHGALWVPLAIGAPPSCVFPAQSRHAEILPPPPPEAEERGVERLAEDDDAEPIEIVDDLGFDDGFDDAIDESPTQESAMVIAEAAIDAASGDEAEAAAPGADPFARLAGLVKDVARTFGADEDGAARLDTLLGLHVADAAVAPHAAAWRGILRGESEDYDACGSATLDEWAADMVVRVVGGAGRSDGIRRELRRRGVAAFGLVA
jgi:hypothetical protein